MVVLRINMDQFQASFLVYLCAGLILAGRYGGISLLKQINSASIKNVVKTLRYYCIYGGLETN